jgi:flagellar biosynthetic protein FliR
VLGQLFMIFGTLTYLAINGHLMLLGALAQSFHTLPIGAHMDTGLFLSVVLWGAHVFDTGLLIALPAVIALVIVNLALGVVTRAAPQLNLFGIGFTITLMSGFFVLLAGLDGIMSGISTLIDSALTAVTALVGSPAAGVP